MKDFRLYVILDVDICYNRRADIGETAHKLILGGAEVIQLRAKGLADREILKIAKIIKNAIQKNKNKSLFVLNDRVDLAYIINADGLHLGQNDLHLKQARKILGNNKVIGISTHNLKEAIAAAKEGADYIGIGPVFPTTTKDNSIPSTLTPEVIVKVKNKLGIPSVAIGGINLHNIGKILKLGIKRVAVCSAIISADNILKATQKFRRRLYCSK